VPDRGRPAQENPGAAPVEKRSEEESRREGRVAIKSYAAGTTEKSVPARDPKRCRAREKRRAESASSGGSPRRTLKRGTRYGKREGSGWEKISYL